MSQHLQTRLVAIERLDLAYNQDLEYFGYIKTQIERGAKLFLEARGFINPLVVKRTNNLYNGVVVEDGTPHDRYEVCSGFLEYFCAVRAKEINPAQEFVQAIIIDNNLEDNLIKQIELFRIGAETIEPDNFWGGDDLDFELLEDEPDQIRDFVNRSVVSQSVEVSSAEAEGLCEKYISRSPIGDRAYQKSLDDFFAEAAEMYE